VVYHTAILVLLLWIRRPYRQRVHQCPRRERSHCHGITNSRKRKIRVDGHQRWRNFLAARAEYLDSFHMRTPFF
jgi:hypothetical protein